MEDFIIYDEFVVRALKCFVFLSRHRSFVFPMSEKSLQSQQFALYTIFDLKEGARLSCAEGKKDLILRGSEKLL